MTNHQFCNQDSGDTEYYTPAPIIEAARSIMGGIDIDPASSAKANEQVKAKKFFALEDDGLSQEWHGTVWMNHPFGRGRNRKWIAKLEQEYTAGRVTQACCITFAATSEKWFRPLLLRPQCFLFPRTQYLLPDGSVKRGVTKGSCVTYFGPNVEAFAREFSSLGEVKVPYQG
jgi:ParB family chromosome partitioning protein